MIFVTNCAGQAGNQFMYFARSLALALDSGRNMLFLCGRTMHEFSELHPEALPSTRVWCVNLPRIKILDGINGLLEALLRKVFGRGVLPPSTADRLASRWHGWPILLWNWNFRNERGMVRHQREIAAFLRAKACYHERAHDILSKLPPHDVVVGVHIRRGDYKNAWGGKYYFSDEQYLGFLKRFEVEIGKKAAFVVVSNERIDVDWFATHGCPLIDGSGRPHEDMVLLSECDCIVGPVSTFSGWAAFYGDKPIYRIEEIDAPIDCGRLRKIYQ